MLVHLPNGYQPEQVATALAATIQTLPEVVRRSLTWDQGPQIRDWKPVAIAADIEIFFCDQHQPWRRGCTENTNDPLRQYFPKGSDLAVHSEAEPYRVAAGLNDRPRNAAATASPSRRSATYSPRRLSALIRNAPAADPDSATIAPVSNQLAQVVLLHRQGPPTPNTQPELLSRGLPDVENVGGAFLVVTRGPFRRADPMPLIKPLRPEIRLEGPQPQPPRARALCQSDQLAADATPGQGRFDVKLLDPVLIEHQ